MRVLMISGSCESNMELIVVEADLEGLKWKNYLYFNLIYVTCAFRLPFKQIPLVI